MRADSGNAGMIIRSGALVVAFGMWLPATAHAGESCRPSAANITPASAHSHHVGYRPAARAESGSPDNPEYRLRDDPQYRLPDDPQYRLSNAAQYRLLPDAAQSCLDCVPNHDDGYRPAVAASGKPPASKMTVPVTRYQILVDATARATGIRPELLHAVIAVESGYDPRARSPKGALGLMQLMPATATRYAVSNPHDPAQNVRAGAQHLCYLLAEFNNDLHLALAAYNAGEDAVRRYTNRIPPYPETRTYVQRVIKSYRSRLSLRKSSPL